jgi:hypothetical protein
MNAPTTTIEKRLADAAALVAVVAYRDFPNGFVVVVDRLPAGTVAVSTGSGVELARLYGHGNGRAAVVVDAAKVATWDAPRLDALILHESSHAIVDADRPGIEAALDTLPTATQRVPEREAHGHRPVWAAALSILCQRANGCRRSHAAIARRVAADLAVYGYDAAALERLTAGVSEDSPLRELLAAGTPAAALLELRTPDIETRTAAIVASGRYGWATTPVIATANAGGSREG